jgi:tetratricopeptide (TPR) repeat protein
VLLPGETPLLAVAGNQPSLWLLEPRPGRVEFIGSAKAALRVAEQRITRDLPLLFDAATLPETWSARRLRTGEEQTLDGSSFGLSFCLAFASLMLAVPLSGDLVATAAVTADGDVEGVDEHGLGLKLRLVHEWAPGIRRVLVAAENCEFAERVTSELGATFEVVPVRSLQGALESAFSGLIEALEAKFDNARKKEHAARRLFELVRDGSQTLLSWHGVAASCRWLAERLPEDSDALREAEFAEAVARRHAGKELPCPVHLPWVEGMPRPLRLRVIAHLVEHSRFHSKDEREVIREFAEQQLASRPLDDGPEDLTALGALGRSYAVFREYPAAERSLRRALRGWRQVGLIEQSSFALSEWLRILGLQGRIDDLRNLLGEPREDNADAALSGYVTEFLAARISSLSRAFVRFALGRAFAQASAPAEALPFLDTSPELDWSLTPAHLQASRLRWFGLALGLQGETARASEVLAELQALAKSCNEAEFAAALADIDRGLALNRDASAALDVLRRLEPQAIRHIELQTESNDTLALARAVAIHYPY